MFNLLKSKWLFVCCGLLLMQQLIVASSTIWITQLAADIYSGQAPWTSLYLYLASLLMPYVPGCPMVVFLAYWKQDVQRNFLKRFDDVNYGQVLSWTQRDEAQRRISALNGEGPAILNAFMDYLFDIAGLLLNLILNVAVVAVIVDHRYAIAYAISWVTVAIFLRFQNPIQSRFAAAAQSARLMLGEKIINAWDNVVLGNRYNFTLWSRAIADRFTTVRHRTIKSDTFGQSVSFAVAIMTMVPSMVVAVTGMHAAIGNKAVLSVYIVTLPRLFLILNFTYMLLAHTTAWPKQRQLVEGILPKPLPSPDLRSRISWSDIQLQGSDGVLALASEANALTHCNGVGRMTVRGPNGSGKSTLLMLLKHALQDRAFYLPAHNHLEFVASPQRSTGQKLRDQLQEIAANVDCPVVLLDEWDANLDDATKDDLSTLITQIAIQKCVIEVRHRV